MSSLARIETGTDFEPGMAPIGETVDGPTELAKGAGESAIGGVTGGKFFFQNGELTFVDLQAVPFHMATESPEY